MKKSDKLMNKMNTIAYKVSSNKYLFAIREAFVSNMPLIITGSFATLFSSVLCSTTSGLAQFDTFTFLADYAPLFTSINYATMNLMAIFICFLVGSSIGKSNGHNERFTGLLALAAYIITIPTEVISEIDGKSVTILNVIANVNTNAQGLFLAMLIGIVSIVLFSKLMNVKKLRIKMPEAVPQSIADSFSSLLPTILTLFLISLVSFSFRAITNMYLSEAILQTLQVPLQGVMQHPLGILVIILVTQVFWFFGLHGANITSAIREPLMYVALAANIDAVAAGISPNMITSKPFWSMYCTIGGSGCTMGLLIAIFLFSKRDDYKAIGKLSALPAIFTINEPLIFGLPLVLNPIMMIPFILAPLVSATIGYFSTLIGFAGAAFVEVPWTTPVFFNSYLATGGSVGAVITQLICLIVAILIYFPFVKLANKEKISSQES